MPTHSFSGSLFKVATYRKEKTGNRIEADHSKKRHNSARNAKALLKYAIIILLEQSLQQEFTFFCHVGLRQESFSEQERARGKRNAEIEI